jgi:hypothetical protein
MPTPYVPQTWTDLSPATPPSARRMRVIERGIVDAQAMPATRALLAANITLPGQTWVQLSLGITAFDTNGMRDPNLPGRITIKTPGVYWLTALVNFSVPVPGGISRATRLLVNATLEVARCTTVCQAGVAERPWGRVGAQRQMIVGDYVELGVFDDSANPYYVFGDRATWWTSMSATLLSY